ncbi:MAG: hypothetical protein HY681_09285 [Chloroflexi bacterium]|nr:hypothetical protein [Chloroflexota bacterium]
MISESEKDLDVGRRRSSLQVIASILKIRGTKTAMMYGAVLSYAQTQKYLALLLARGLLQATENGNGKTVYEASEKGKKLLALIETLETFVGDWEEELEAQS